MLRSLLIGVNGSDWSPTAIELGLEWARNLKIPVTLMGVVDVDALTAAEPVPLGASGFKADRDAHRVAAARRRTDDALQAAARQAADAGVEHHVKLVEGNPARMLGEEVQRHDLLVVGRRGIPDSDRDPPASTTLSEILHHTSRPVVVAASKLPADSAVVIAYDGSPQAARTLASFVASGLYYGHPLHLVGIGDEPSRMQGVLTRALDYLSLHGQTATLHVLPQGRSVPETLEHFTRALPAGLLVMGVYGQSRLKEFFFGSATTSMLAHAPVPLFLDH